MNRRDLLRAACAVPLGALVPVAVTRRIRPLYPERVVSRQLWRTAVPGKTTFTITGDSWTKIAEDANRRWIKAVLKHDYPLTQ